MTLRAADIREVLLLVGYVNENRSNDRQVSRKTNIIHSEPVSVHINDYFDIFSVNCKHMCDFDIRIRTRMWINILIFSFNFSQNKSLTFHFHL